MFKFKLLLLLTTTALIYAPSLFNQFIWDDEQFIYNNQIVLQFDLPNILTKSTTAGAGVISNYYRPLTTISFAIDHAIWKLQPFGFHLTNTLLHAGAGVMLYLLLINLGIGNKKLTLTKDPAFWLSLIFLLHPIQTEAVVYINSRGDSLSALLSFATLLLFVKIIKKDQHYSNSFLPTGIFPIYTVGLYLTAILAKEIALSALGLMALIYLYQLLINKQTIKHKTAVITLLLTFFTAMSYLTMRLTVLNFANTINFYDGTNLYTQSVVIRLLTFCKVIWVYLKLLIFPYPLHMERDISWVTSFGSIWPWLTLILVLSLFFAGLFEWRKKSTPYIWFGSLWSIICLVPVSGLIPINGLLYEHWLYLPMIGFFIVIWRLGVLLLSPAAKLKPLTEFALIALISICSLLTIRQNWLWRSPIVFYEYLLQYAQSARIHNNLGMAYAENKQANKAIEQYQKALGLNSAYPQIYHNLGNTYAGLGQLDKAIEYYNQALKLQPNFTPSTAALIKLYKSNNQQEKALELESALRKD